MNIEELKKKKSELENQLKTIKQEIDSYYCDLPTTEHPDYKGFFLINRSGKHYINKNGEVIGKYGYVLRPGKDRDYQFVSLGKGIGHFRVHRLVAETFIPNPDKKPMVNHKNGVRNDNRVENLEWVNQSENSLHSIHVLGKTNKGKNNRVVTTAMKEQGLTYGQAYWRYVRRFQSRRKDSYRKRGSKLEHLIKPLLDQGLTYNQAYYKVVPRKR